ncbi:MAG: adaptor protein MecA [Blautia sp.]|nr:adaptor protein MecA [Blautia sp.]
MKIEKINENQIRCTLTKEDLEDHQIRISELAYGSDKAKQLFRDMMQQAQIQYGFEADNIPLMIEAIPISPESIVLIITKVEDPEELDTRFSKFAPFKGKDQAEQLQLDGADNIIDIFQKLYESKFKNAQKDKDSQSVKGDNKPDQEKMTEVNLIRLYEFDSLDNVIAASHALNGFFNGANTLYRENPDETYKLVVHQSSSTPEDFNKVCNILTEYGRGRAFSLSGEAHLKEHGELISENALQQLIQL